LADFDNKYLGNMTIRNALAQSRNIPAVEAMYLAGRDPTLQTIHDMGDKSYCTQGVDQQVGLASAIGGCGLKQIEHANSFATIARGGVYKPVASVLEVRNSQNQVIQQWKDDQAKQVIDPQIPYLLESILSDDNARAPSFGRGASGLNVPGVKTFTKTGTSNIGTKSSNLWMNSVTPKATTTIWVGNHDSRPMSNALSSIVGPTINKIVGPIHTQIFAKDGTWKAGDWFTQPPGIQTLSVAGHTDIFPSWYNSKSQPNNTSQLSFDKVSKKKATSCTPDAAKINVTVVETQDPITHKTTVLANDGYDAANNDDTHNCNDVQPFVTDVSASPAGGGQYTVTANVTQGTHPLQTVQITVDGNTISQQGASASGAYSATATLSAGAHTVVVTVTDVALYSGTITKTISTSGP
jgi:membrane peptidoglycan carboxypeptidase